jgi:hypothetical protein
LGIYEPVRGGELLQRPLLQHLPASSLQHLACTLDWRSAAQIAALSQLTALRTLSVLGPGGERSWHNSYSSAIAGNNGHAVLEPLSALQQLTFLESVNTHQLQHLQLPQLQQLEITIAYSSDVNPQGALQLSHLRLGHLTGLSKLTVEGSWALPDAASQLPPNLQELSYPTGSCARHSLRGSWFSVQPLLALSRLQKLHLAVIAETASGALALQLSQLSRLSSLSSLQAVRLSCVWGRLSLAGLSKMEDAAASVAAAWGVLPLKELQWSSLQVPAAVVRQISALTGLTRLALSSRAGQYGHIQATHAELAVTLTKLAALRRLSMCGFKSMALPHYSNDVVSELEAAGLPAAAHLYAAEVARAVDSSVGDMYSTPWLCHGIGGVAVLLQAVGMLHALEDVCVVLRVKLNSALQMQTMQGVLQQVLPEWLLTCLQVTATRVAVEL